MCKKGLVQDWVSPLEVLWCVGLVQDWVSPLTVLWCVGLVQDRAVVYKTGRRHYKLCGVSVVYKTGRSCTRLGVATQRFVVRRSCTGRIVQDRAVLYETGRRHQQFCGVSVSYKIDRRLCVASQLKLSLYALPGEVWGRRHNEHVLVVCPCSSSDPPTVLPRRRASLACRCCGHATT